MSRCGIEMWHLYRPDRRAIKRIPSRNAVATTAVGYMAFSVVAYILVLLFVALVTILNMSLPLENRPKDWRVFWTTCKVFPPVVFVRCIFWHLELWCATKEAIADVEFMDQIFEELYEDAESLLEKKLPLGDERWNRAGNLANDYADASHMLIKFLVRERKQIAKEKMEGDVEKGRVRRGDIYILMMKSVLELRKQIMLECVKQLVNLPVGAERMDSMAASCKEFGRIVNDTQQARSQAWWTAEKSVKDMEKADEMERLLEQSITECIGGVLLDEMA
jgi:hypothetical protein